MHYQGNDVIMIMSCLSKFTALLGKVDQKILCSKSLKGNVGTESSNETENVINLQVHLKFAVKTL